MDGDDGMGVRIRHTYTLESCIFAFCFSDFSDRHHSTPDPFRLDVITRCEDPVFFYQIHSGLDFSFRQGTGSRLFQVAGWEDC